LWGLQRPDGSFPSRPPEDRRLRPTAYHGRFSTAVCSSDGRTGTAIVNSVCRVKRAAPPTSFGKGEPLHDRLYIKRTATAQFRQRPNRCAARSLPQMAPGVRARRLLSTGDGRTSILCSSAAAESWRATTARAAAGAICCGPGRPAGTGISADVVTPDVIATPGNAWSGLAAWGFRLRFDRRRWRVDARGRRFHQAKKRRGGSSNSLPSHPSGPGWVEQRCRTAGIEMAKPTGRSRNLILGKPWPSILFFRRVFRVLSQRSRVQLYRGRFLRHARHDFRSFHEP